jgi:hypothetical protein
MADQTLNPTANETPDSTQGGLAVTGATNTGHGVTLTAQIGAGTETKTCRWFGIVSPGRVQRAVTVLAGWSRTAAALSGGGSNIFRIEYSVDGGSNWTAMLTQTNVTGAASGTASASLSSSQNINLIQVRDFMRASVSGSGSASIGVSISDVRVEVDFSPGGLLVMM